MGFEFNWPWEEGRIFGYKGPFWKIGESVTYIPRALGVLPPGPGEPTVGIPAGVDWAKGEAERWEAKANTAISWGVSQVQETKEMIAEVIEPILGLTEDISGLTDTMTGLADTVRTFVSNITVDKIKEIVPSMPEIKMPEIKMPDLTVLMPEIKMPEISIAGTDPISLWPVALLGLAIAGVAILG